MASASAVSMALPLARKRQPPTAGGAFLKTFSPPASAGASQRVGKFEVKASLREKAVAGVAAAAMAASMVVPDVAEAASGVSPSLKNFLLSIGAGGVVLTAILGAIIGVSNFDPVKRS